ncbi:MAG TPA: hypothetical protein VF422_04300 [Dokdonella sp.]
MYDQTGAASNGAPVQEFQAVYAAYSAEGADDFVVTDAAGWNVSAFNFTVSFTAAPPPTITYDVNVYPDSSGLPGATATCSYTAIPGVVTGGTGLSVALPSACSLPQGTYWVALQANVDFPPQMFWSNKPDAGLGSNGAWRNPGGGFGAGCPNWADITTCGGSSPVGGGNPAFLFQVVGAVGGGGGDECTAGELCLEVTLGTDTTAGACGTADSLDVTVGDQVNYCYTVTNDTGTTLEFHTLSDNINGTIFSLMPQTLADGASFQYNRIATAGGDETLTSMWAAQDVPPGYTAEVTSGEPPITDRVFCDGFDGEACDPGGGGGGFIDISGSGTPLGLTDDGEANVTMPFSITLYGTTSNQLRVANNGAILFGATSGDVGFTNSPLPMAGAGPVIAPLWDDFDGTQGDVYHGTVGTAPNRQFVVQWNNRAHYPGSTNTDGATFEVVFDEATGQISFQYLDVSYPAVGNVSSDPDDCTNGVCATIGLQSDDSLFNEFSFMSASITNNSGIEWTATSPTVFTDDDTTTLNVGAPDIEVDPTSVSGSVPEGGTTDLTLDINNVGDRDLVWDAEEAPSPTAHFPPPGTRFAMPLGDPALANAGPAPLALRKPVNKVPGPLAAPNGGGVPVFAADIYNGFNMTFDALSPGATTQVGGNHDYALVGGAFIDGDFSTMISIDGFSAGHTNAFVRVDTATGVITDVATATNSLGEGWTSLDYDSTTGNLYATSSACGSDSHLWTMNPATGASTLVGSIGSGTCIVAMAVSPDGLMYGIDIINDALFAIDKTTGTGTLIGSIGFNANYAQDMTFDQATGVLYYAGFDGGSFTDQIYTVDLATGATTAVGNIGAGLAEVDAMAIMTAGGPCSQPTDLPWLTIAPASGTTAPGGTTPVTLSIDPGAAVEGDTLSGTVCISSNDPDEHRVEVPVEVTVGPGGGGGDIVDSGVVNIAVPATFDGVYINWFTGATCTSSCGGAGYMFNPYNSSGLNFFWPSGGGNSTQNGGVVVGGAYAVLTSGETIDAARTFSTGNTATLLANWRAGATGYLGFRFLNPSTTTINYGYAQFTTTGATGFPATIVRYVYNSAGNPITIP